MIKRGKIHSPIARRTAEDFEKCQKRKSGRKEEEALLMIEGNRLLLTCPLCLPPTEDATGLWRRILPGKASVVPVLPDGRRIRVLSDLSLEITEARRRDAGIYICQQDADASATYAVDVKDREPHEFVVLSGKKKKPNRRRPFRDVPLPDLNLVVGMSWSEWSPCNRCGDVGRRRRVGICTVRKLDPKRASSPVDSRMLDEYRKGLPCRSDHLPQEIRNLSVVFSTKSQFVVGFCKVPCPTSAGIVVVTDSSGKVVDTVDNSRGIYSMQQPLPPLPRLAKRRTVYEEEGASIVLACPGNTEGKFLIWRNESYVLNPSRVHVRTKGRVRIDFANNLRVRRLRRSDTAVYSCWDDKHLVGTVRLQVTEKTAGKAYRLYILNIGVLFTFLTVFMVGLTVCKNARLQTKE